MKPIGTAIQSTTYVNTFQAERLCPNDVLDLQLKYKNNPEVLAILDQAIDPYKAIDEAIESELENNKDILELDRMREDVTGDLETAEEKLESILDTLDIEAGKDNDYTPEEQLKRAAHDIAALQIQLRNLLSRTEEK